MKRFVLVFLCITTFMFVFTGCRKDMNEEEVMKYLENRYHQTFMPVSSKEYPRARPAFPDEIKNSEWYGLVKEHI